MKKVSIITINYNNCIGLQKTIESVISQKYSNYEYIVIDGGSTDGSIDILKQHTQEITYWVSEKDKGIYNAMNKGIQKATGEFCHFLNSGDIYHDQEVLTRVFIVDHHCDILTGTYISTNSSTPIGQLTPLSMVAFVKNSLGHPCSFIKRSLFNDHLYDESYKIVSDWKFFIEAIIFQNCNVKYIDTIITIYDTTGISSVNHELNQLERTTVLKELLPPRIYIDYIRYAQSDSPLLELTPFFNKTKGFQKLIYQLVYSLIWVRKIIFKTFRKSSWT